eukprot:CAMPEP_0185003970 /NCGR_PEP_ID=MMETSP1098-20130426/77978_1 /TAXON_ID=89044 /ORGANISM="Spumella elongata, Strain CCAP 955/1" /LENGTH=650 /DNA_ID=CAMNT_0027531715 /DNA_START=17 /DNA_END=1965 /DNA_ORIENTATION=+
MKRKAGELENSVENSDAYAEEEEEVIDEENSGNVVDGNGRVKCPYLDTINRQAIDFDSEKLCSVTLTNMNVYVCLVCGKYFQGRGKMTPAYTHSVQAGHFVFMNLHSGRTFCLPDGYEVLDSSLQDVQSCLSPTFSLQELAQLSSNTSLARDVHGVSYLPGFIGLNNLNCTDYLNALLHALAHVAPFRDYWLQNDHYALTKSTVAHQFGLALRKMWSGKNFKSTVSPQELVQELSVESKKRFSLGQRAECLDLLVWLLGTLHRGLGKAANAPITAPAVSNNNASAASSSKTVRPNPAADQASSVVYEPFQGIIEVTTLTKRLVSSAEELRGQDPATQLRPGETLEGEWVRSTTQVPFTYLSLDIPACPLFRDSEGGLVIPQVPLFELLKKFDGSTWTDTMTSEAHVRRQYRILQLPRYLILHLVRFTRNNFYLEKNPTIVTFPVKNLEMKEYLQVPAAAGDVEGDGSSVDKNDKKKPSLGERKAREEARMLQSCPSLEQVSAMSNTALRQLIVKFGADLHKLQLQAVSSAPTAFPTTGKTSGGAEERAQLLIIAQSVVERVQLFGATKYDLLSNICHGSDASSSSTKGGITVGDLNMLLGQSSGAHKGKAKTSAAAGSGASGVVSSSTGGHSSNSNSGGGGGGADSTGGG